VTHSQLAQELTNELLVCCRKPASEVADYEMKRALSVAEKRVNEDKKRVHHVVIERNSHSSLGCAGFRHDADLSRIQ
jgi:hypothetical protein